jgi:hypothetical protein
MHTVQPLPPSGDVLTFAEANGFLTASLLPEHFTSPATYFLGIQTSVGSKQLAAFVEEDTRFRLYPASVRNGLLPVVLKEEPIPPLELPIEPGLHYFRLDHTANPRLWQKIEQEKSVILVWRREELNLSAATFTLHIVHSVTPRPPRPVDPELSDCDSGVIQEPCPGVPQTGDIAYLYPLTPDLTNLDPRVLFLVHGNFIYPGRDHPYCKAHPDRCGIFGAFTAPWFRFQDKSVFTTSAHPGGVSDQPHYRVGNIPFQTGQHKFTLAGLLTAEGHPSGTVGRPAYVFR